MAEVSLGKAILKAEKVESARERVARLTEEWYELIGPEPHKDRDCRFHVTEDWAWGGAPRYLVAHKGYIEGEFHGGPFNTQDEAYQWLAQRVDQMIQHELWHQTHLNDEDPCPFERCGA